MELVTYLDVEMSYLPVMEIYKALYKLTHELDHVCFKWHQIVVYDGLQIASRSAVNIRNLGLH
jgi:hypothetical protein